MNQYEFEQMKERGSGVLAPDAVATLYHQAFEEFGSHSLWSRQPGAQPTIAQALVVADCLRVEGNVQARKLAEQIEQACHAAL